LRKSNVCPLHWSFPSCRLSTLFAIANDMTEPHSFSYLSLLLVPTINHSRRKYFQISACCICCEQCVVH
jgi:hypothetical protein